MSFKIGLSSGQIEFLKQKQQKESKEEELKQDNPEKLTLDNTPREPITASAWDIISQNMRQTVVTKPSAKNVQSGVYELPEGRVTVHSDENGKIGVQVVGEPVADINGLLRKIVNTTPTQTLTSEPNGINGCNGEIDEPVSQGGTGDCWLITGILALTATEEGKALIKGAMDIQPNGDVIVSFKGLGVSIRVTAEEIARFDTDNNKDDPFSNGDNDMLVFELAVEKLFEQYPELISQMGWEDKGFNDADGYIDQGSVASNLFILLTDESTGVGSNFANECLADSEQVDEVVIVPELVAEKYGSWYASRPAGMSEEEMYNADKTDFSSAYLEWKYKYLSTLVNGISEENTLSLLQQLYENQPCAVTFGLYIFAGETIKSATDINGKTFTFSYDGAKKGTYCGHAFSIVGMTENTVTFVNPWDSTEKITMTWEEFAKLGIGGFEYALLPKAVETETSGTENAGNAKFNSVEELENYIYGDEFGAILDAEGVVDKENRAKALRMTLEALGEKYGEITKDDVWEIFKITYVGTLWGKIDKTKPGGGTGGSGGTDGSGGTSGSGGTDGPGGAKGPNGPTSGTGDWASESDYINYINSQEFKNVLDANGYVDDNIRTKALQELKSKYEPGLTKKTVLEKFNTLYKGTYMGTKMGPYAESQLKELSAEDIKKYFFKNSSNTYSVRYDVVCADFPKEEYGVINTLDALINAIKKNNPGNATSGDFASYSELKDYLFSNEARNQLGLDFSGKNFTYEQIAEKVSKAHENSFDTVTKQQLLDEFIAEYNRLNETIEEGPNVGEGSFKDIGDLLNWAHSDDIKTALLKSLGIENIKQPAYATGVSNFLKYYYKDNCTTVTKQEVFDKIVANYNDIIDASKWGKADYKPDSETNPDSPTDPDVPTNSDGTKGTEGGGNATDTGKGDFAYIGQLQTYVHSDEAKKALKDRGLALSEPDYSNWVTKYINEHYNSDTCKNVTKEQILEEIIKNYPAPGSRNTSGTSGAGGTSGTDSGEKTGKDFNSYAALRNYLFAGDTKAELSALDFKNKGFNYEQIADFVANNHKNDWATVTKQQLLKEFTDEYNKRAGKTTRTNDTSGSGEAPGTSGAGGSNSSHVGENAFKTYQAMVDFLNSLKTDLCDRGYQDVVEQAIKNVANRHSQEYASMTENELRRELLDECDELLHQKNG